jgi:hypothetical protein
MFNISILNIISNLNHGAIDSSFTTLLKQMKKTFKQALQHIHFLLKDAYKRENKKAKLQCSLSHTYILSSLPILDAVRIPSHSSLEKKTNVSIQYHKIKIIPKKKVSFTNNILSCINVSPQQHSNKATSKPQCTKKILFSHQQNLIPLLEPLSEKSIPFSIDPT